MAAMSVVEKKTGKLLRGTKEVLSSGDGQVTSRKSGRKRQNVATPVAELQDGSSKSGCRKSELEMIKC